MVNSKRYSIFNTLYLSYATNWFVKVFGIVFLFIPHHCNQRVEHFVLDVIMHKHWVFAPLYQALIVAADVDIGFNGS